MVLELNPPLRPRSGRTLKVLLPGRVSDPRPGKQSLTSLDDQQDLQHRWLAEHTDLPVEITVIAGSGSGEMLERDEYQRVLELIASREYHLVLTEDLGRIVRRLDAFKVCELCEDCDVRLISINNQNVDTATPGWRDAAFFAAYFYEKENRDKSQRLKERLRSRFNAGGAIPSLIYGYIKEPDAATDDGLRKDPAAEPIYAEWFRRLDEEEASYASIADWLNSQDITVGPSSQNKEWDGRMVARVTHNPLLKGIRFHNKHKSRRINESGRYRSIKASPDELLTRRVAHLAFFEEAYYDHVVAKVDARNTLYRRKGDNGCDTRCNVPKKRTRFPGQSVFCGICGRMYVFGGHGQTDRLMCNGARDHKCWNGATVDGPLATERISAAILSEIETLKGYDEVLLEQIEAEAQRQDASRREQIDQLRKAESKTERELENVLKAIRSGVDAQSIKDELDRLEREKESVAYELAEAIRRQDSQLVLPPIEELKELARETFEKLAWESFEFADALRRFVPRVVVFPHRLVDGGHVVLRGKFRLRLANLISNQKARESIGDTLDRVLEVDLFDPPQREEFRARVVAGRQRGETEQQVAKALDITHTAAQRAAALQRQMDAMGIDDPYLPVDSPPKDYGKMKRHQHSRYQFDPLPDAGQI